MGIGTYIFIYEILNIRDKEISNSITPMYLQFFYIHLYFFFKYMKCLMALESMSIKNILIHTCGAEYACLPRM
jgi:hypothetical protein